MNTHASAHSAPLKQALLINLIINVSSFQSGRNRALKGPQRSPDRFPSLGCFLENGDHIHKVTQSCPTLCDPQGL